MAYGITSTGFVIKDFATIQGELQDIWKAAFGNDVDVSDESINGQIINNLSKKFADNWELLQAIYNAFNPDSAEGAALDNVSVMVDVTRLPATAASAIVTLYGTLGTLISTGHLIQQSITAQLFALLANVTISLSSVSDCIVGVQTVINNETYTITINGIDYTYLSDSSATALEIVTGLKASIDGGAAHSIVNTALIGSTLQIIDVDAGANPFVLAVDSNLQVNTIGTPGNYESQNTGAISVPANSLVTIVNPISGLSAVKNLAEGVSGTEIETDQEMRQRRRIELAGLGNATDEAIMAKIIKMVPGITAAIVYSNRTDGVVDGRPAHSFEAVVMGGSDQAIADRIWLIQPSGIQPYGSTTKTVIDSMGQSQTVKFSRPTVYYIWVNISIHLYPEELFPENGPNDIAQSITSYALTEFTIGKDVYYQRLYYPIYNFNGTDKNGIGTVDVLEIGYSLDPLTPPVSFASANIVIASNQIASFDPSRITVTILG